MSKRELIDTGIDKPSYFHVGDAAELVRRAGSKALAGWGRADQELPDL